MLYIVKNSNIYYRECSSIFITAILKYKNSFLPILTTPFLVKNTFCDFKSLDIKSFKIMKYGRKVQVLAKLVYLASCFSSFNILLVTRRH